MFRFVNQSLIYNSKAKQYDYKFCKPITNNFVNQISLQNSPIQGGVMPPFVIRLGRTYEKSWRSIYKLNEKYQTGFLENVPGHARSILRGYLASLLRKLNP